MPDRSLRLIACCLFIALTGTDTHAQKRGKKHAQRARSTQQGMPTQKTGQGADLRNPVSGAAGVPQQSSLTPEIKKTKKVVIVPAPSPPPGPDPVPPYPKR